MSGQPAHASSPIIGVVGAGEASPDQLATAHRVGQLLGEAGATLVCGGLGGVMEAACRGAVEAGGLTVGLLPGQDPTTANPYVRVPLATGLGELRNGLIVRASQALIAVAGGPGTLSEIALALKAGKPVHGLDSWDIPGVRSAAGPEEAVAAALR